MRKVRYLEVERRVKRHRLMFPEHSVRTRSEVCFFQGSLLFLYRNSRRDFLLG